MEFRDVVLWLRNAATGALTPVSAAAPVPVQEPAIEAAIGTPADPPWPGGTAPATLIALGKAASSPVAAIEPATGSGAYQQPVSVGTSSTPVISADLATKFLDIQNTSEAATVTLYDAAGHIIRILTPLATYTREGSFIPTDAISASASNGTATLAVGFK